MRSSLLSRINASRVLLRNTVSLLSRILLVFGILLVFWSSLVFWISLVFWTEVSRALLRNTALLLSWIKATRVSVRNTALLLPRIALVFWISLVSWINQNGVLLRNTASLVGTSAVTSGLGFVFWWLAVREYSPEAVGLGSVAVSGMTLLGTFSSLGAGWMLIGELTRRRGEGGSLIAAALYVVGFVGIVTGTIFALVAPSISHNFVALRANWPTIALFALGVGLMPVTIVLDQSLVGLMRGELQFVRNTVFALIKLGVLFLAGLVLAAKVGITIYVAWVSGFVLSLIVLGGYALIYHPNVRHYLIHPNWGLMGRLGPLTAKHYMLNNMLQVPIYVMPLLVSVLLSLRANAWFYVSFQLANFVLIIPVALTTVLYATNSSDRALLSQRTRLTLSLSLGASIVADIVLLVATRQVLAIYGHLYQEQATLSLRILSLTAFPQIVKSHYIALCRIQNKMLRGIVMLSVASVFEIGCAAAGAKLGGLPGLSAGWLIALCAEALIMLPTVYRAVYPRIAMRHGKAIAVLPSHGVSE